MAGKFGGSSALASRARQALRHGRRTAVLRSGLLASVLALAGGFGLAGVAGMANAANPAQGIATDPNAQNLGDTLGPGAIVIPGNNAAAGGVATNAPNNPRSVAPAAAVNANNGYANGGANGGVASAPAQQAAQAPPEQFPVPEHGNRTADCRAVSARTDDRLARTRNHYRG